MKWLALPRGDWPLILGGALLYVLAFPPFHLLIPSFLCLIPAVRLIVDAEQDARPLRRRLVQGFWFGFLARGFVLYWMPIALWRFTPFIVFGYVATVAILALYMAGAFALTGWITRKTPLPLVLVFPVLWTAMDWAIGHQGDIRFPWLGLGTSLTGFPTLVQLADVVGARGVGLLLVAANAALALAWMRMRERRVALRYLAGVIAGVVLALGYGLVRERQIATRPVGVVAVIQPNIEEKWDGGPDKPDPDSIVYGTARLAEQALEETQARLVVWPEVAVPDYFVRHPGWYRSIASLAIRHQAEQLVGGLDWARPDGGFEYYNAAFLFDRLGRADAQPVYHKQYLVPITERVPFVNPRWFKLTFFGGFAEGDAGPVYRVGIGTFGVLICYESIFENLARDYRRRGGEFLVNITNDAWFGRTSAPYQHAAHLVMRAIENRMGVARAANTGISEFVDPLGREHRRTGLYVRTFVADTLVTSDHVTLYTRWGDWLGWLSVVVAIGFGGFAWWRRR